MQAAAAASYLQWTKRDQESVVCRYLTGRAGNSWYLMLCKRHRAGPWGDNSPSFPADASLKLDRISRRCAGALNASDKGADKYRRACLLLHLY